MCCEVSAPSYNKIIMFQKMKLRYFFRFVFVSGEGFVNSILLLL